MDRVRTLSVFLLTILVLVVMAGVPWASAAAKASPAGTDALPCALFPADNIWNTPVDNLPVHPSSDTYINTIGRTKTFHPDFGSGIWDGGPIGIPYNIVPGTQTKVNISFYYPDESDSGPYPIPANPLIEGGPNATGDRHILVLDRDNCLLYEVYDAWPNNNGGWDAGSGAIYNLNSHALRPAGWTSADAAGLPILPGLVRYDEILAGEINHAIRFTVPQTRRAYVWPARHYASILTGAQYPPMGQRFRLKANFDISGFDPTVQIILRAMKKYGIILADNGSAWFFSGVPDSRWNDDTLVTQFRQITGDNFEAVDVSSLMIDANSGQAKQSGTPTPPATPGPTPTPTSTPTPTPTPPPDHIIYLSTVAGGTVGSIPFTGADILTYGKTSNTWGMLYDGSAAGTVNNLNAFSFLDNDILLNFTGSQVTPGLGTLAAQDIARFTPTTTGLNNTSGAFSWYFDGSDVGLTTNAEAIDALWIDGSGRLYLSSEGSGSVPANSAVPAGAKINFQDEDILRFTFSGSPGATTAGTWSLYYDATLLPGMSKTNVTGYWEDPATGNRYMTLGGNFSIGASGYGIASGNRKSIVKLTANAAAPGGYAPAIEPWLKSGAAFPATLDAIELDR